MITIIHGEDTVKTRQALIDFKKNKHAIEFQAKNLILEQLRQEIEGTSLFGEQNLIIIENLLKTGGKSLLDYLQANAAGLKSIILWEDGDTSKKSLQIFPKAEVLHYPLPKTIWLFLDSIKPGAGKLSIRLLHETIKTSEPELVFYMLTRHFRLMLVPPTSLAPWQLGKLKRQSALFGQEKLIVLYRKLFQIELEQKTGKSPLSLVAALDLFLLEI